MMPQRILEEKDDLIDAEKLMEMTEKMTEEEESVNKLMEEWESLEEDMAEMSYAWIIHCHSVFVSNI